MTLLLLSWASKSIKFNSQSNKQVKWVSISNEKLNSPTYVPVEFIIVKQVDSKILILKSYKNTALYKDIKMSKDVDKQIVTTSLVLVLILLLPTFASLYNINRSIVTANNNYENDYNTIANGLGKQIHGIVNNFIGKVKEKAINSSSCDDIGTPSVSTGEIGQTTISNNGDSSNVISIQGSDGKGRSNNVISSSGSSSGIVSSSSSSGMGSSVITGSSSNTGTNHGDNGSQSIVSVLGGSDSSINNMICGGPGNSVLVGGPGNNIIYGGPGNNTLIAGPNNNVLIGGSGADHFICNSGHTTIRDFNPSEGDTKTDNCKNY